jgi:hypothetical protein
VFHVRSIFPDQGRVSSASFELNPTNAQAEAVCCLFQKFLANRPACFRERLAFLRKGDFELDWSAAPGGVALATLIQDAEPSSMSVLVTGVQPDTDAMMLDVFRENVLAPLFDGEYDSITALDLRPLIIEVIFPGHPDWAAALQLLTASLGSVYFRTVLEMPRLSV